MPQCKICGEVMTANKEVMAGYSFSTRVWECLCGFKRNLFKREEHDEWEKAERTKSQVPQDRKYNYIHCLDKPDKSNRGIPSKISKDKCSGTCGNDCKCVKDGGSKGGCSGGGCSGCK